MSKLYVVATPLGNLEDFSPRARRLLEECDLILAEDTRVTRKLLSAFSIKTPLESCHEHNEAQKSGAIIQRMITEDMTVCLVSDAGTPAVSDPGALLVAAAHEAGIRVLAVPGPSAQAAALSVSGMLEDQFTFYGFLPRKKGELEKKLADMRGKACLAVLYEAPHRVKDLLAAIVKVYPGAKMSISREISKLHEQTLTGSAEELLARFHEEENVSRGEFCLVLKVPEAEVKPAHQTLEDISLEARLMDALVKGNSLRDAMERMTREGHRKNQVYDASLRMKEVAGKLLKTER